MNAASRETDAIGSSIKMAAAMVEHVVADAAAFLVIAPLHVSYCWCHDALFDEFMTAARGYIFLAFGK